MSSAIPSPVRRSFDPRWIVLVALWAGVALRIGSEFSGRGAQFWHHDLRTLHRDQATFYRGEYPALAEARRSAAGGEAASRPTYPPYSFPLAVPWLPPGLDWPGTRVWFSLCQLAATAIVAGFVWSLARNDAPQARWMLLAAVLAMTGLRADLLFGNFSVLMTALLAGMATALGQRRRGLAGAAWIASLLKPQMGWLFAVLFLPRRGWPVLGAAAAVVVLATAATCLWVGVMPLDALPTAYVARVSDETLAADRISLVSVLAALGANANLMLPACALAGTAAAAAAVLTRLRTAPVAVQVAFVATVNRICTYHNACDDLLLVFALALLGRRAWRSGAGRDWALFLALGATVWAPTVALQTSAARMVVVAVWLVVAVDLVLRGGRMADDREPAPEETEPAGRRAGT